MILNFGIEKIIAERHEIKEANKKGLEAKNNLKIEKVEEVALEPLTKEKILKITFTYSIQYTPKIATIELTGNVLYMADEKRRKEIIEGWKKEKKLDTNLAQIVINYALNRCNIRALTLGQELNVPPHIPFPRITTKTEEKKK